MATRIKWLAKMMNKRDLIIELLAVQQFSKILNFV